MKRVEKMIRVMLIDDHQIMLWGLTKLIQAEKPRMDVVGAARNGEEAVALASELLPDVILLDLDLGGKSGLDILPALLSNRNSRILILTGGRDQATLDRAILGGARGVLRKEAAAEQLLKAIEKVNQGELWLEHEALCRVFGEFMNPDATRRVDPEVQRKSSLTARERKIVQMIVKESGASNKAIAQRLFISEHTLRNHLTSIYQKLGVCNRLELYVYAVKHQLDDTPAAPHAMEHPAISRTVQANSAQ